MDHMVMQQIDLLDQDQIRNLLNISNIVNSKLDLNSILETIVDTISANTIWPIVGIVIVDEAKKEVWFAAQRGFRIYKSIEEDRWTLDLSLSPKSISSGKTIVVEDFLKLEDLPGVRDYCIECGYRSAVVVPLKDVTPGTVLWLCTPDVTQHTESDVAFAECLANQVAIAYRNANLYQQSRSQAAELAKINYSVGELLKMVVERNTPEKIRDAATRLVNYPIWFEDQFGNRIPDHDGPSVPDRMEQILPVHYRCSDKNALAIPVVSGTEQFGWLLTWDSTGSFKDSDVSFLTQLALVFSLVFLKERVMHEVESQIRMDLFSSLVSSVDTNVKANITLTQRARALRVELPQPGRVAILDLRVDKSPIDLSYQDKLARTSTSISRWIPKRLVAIQDQYIAILISPGEEQHISERLAELRYYFPNARPLLAVGEVVQSINQYGHSLASAFKVLKAGHYLQLKGPVIMSEDLGIYSVLFDPNRQGELEFFSRRLLDRLLSNDTQGIYWETLKAFFDQNCHLDSTAKILNVHISTLRYRLERIRTLFGIDWQQSDSRLQTHIAIEVEKWKRSQGS